MKIIYKKTGELIPYVNNARTHSEEQVTQIASSIKEFGFNNPILLDGSNGVVAGHGRLMAAKKLGLQGDVETSLAMTAKRKAEAAERLLAATDGYCKAACKERYSEDGFCEDCYFRCIAQKCRDGGYKIKKARKVFIDD